MPYLTELERLRDIIKRELAVMVVSCRKCKEAQVKIFDVLNMEKRASYLDDAVRMLMKDEGFSPTLYLCPSGKKTIGFGWNIDETPITYEDALYLLEREVERKDAELSEFKWYRDLNDARKTAMIDMLYCHGLAKFMMYKNMIAALEAKDYTKAANEILSSLWATKQAHKRAIKVAMIIKTGNLET